MAEPSGIPDSLSEEWNNLAWTSWVPFSTTSRALDAVPDKPGLYRIRATEQGFLMYIGWTGFSLRQCFRGIRENTTKVVMPWNDPWEVAPALWAWKDAKKYAYEFSSVPSDDTLWEQKSLESYLVYHYRQEHRESPLCNFGRFHRKYRKPSNQKDGIAGGKIGPNEPLNPAGGPSASPLPVTGLPGDPGWMGIDWSPRRSLKTHTTGVVPPRQGYYLIFDAVTGTILAIGSAQNCAQELFSISRNPWGAEELAYAFYCEPKPLADHNLLERENDLIGNFIEHYWTAPACQFRNCIGPE